MQLELFEDLQIQEQTKRFICGKEYRKLNLLTPYSCQHKNIWVNDAVCKGYEAGKENFEVYFDNEKDRDKYLNELNKVCGVDENGNNLDWYFKIWNYIQTNKWDFWIQRIWIKSIFHPEWQYLREKLKK